MKINRHNYEAYLLDQLEGTLSVEDRQELEQFLLLNPDCAPELEELEPLVLKGEKLSFQHTAILKKLLPDAGTVLDEHNFDMFSIARMEGDLEAKQILDHQAMLETDAQKAALWKQWQQTRLVAEPHVFPDKGKLKHKRPVWSIMPWIGVVSAAAAIALLLVLFRTGAELPQPELITQAPVEAEAVEAPEITEEKVLAAVSTIQVQEDQTENTKTVREFTTIQETSPPEEAVELLEMRPRSRALPANLFPVSYAVKEAQYDRIEPLQIAPVPVSMRSLTLAQISDIGIQEVLEGYAEENNLSLWRIANAGIKGINRLAGSDISLLASRDEDGDISGYQLKSKRFSISRPLGVEE